MKLLLVGLLLAAASQSFASDYTQQCFEETQPLPWKYCVHTPSDGVTGDVIYHLHGKGGDEQYWMDDSFYTGQIRKIWSQKAQLLPVVISISFGPFWLLAEKNKSRFSGLFELFVYHVIPTVESKITTNIGKRVLLGESMGGFNSTQLVLKTKKFNKAAILCTPMSELSPFVAPAEVNEYIKDKAAYVYYGKDTVLNAVNEMIKLAKVFFPTPADWAMASPIVLAQTPGLQFKDLYVAIGMYDKYAAYEATEVFVDHLVTSGARVDWRPQWGGHCAMDIPSLADFLLK